METIYFAPPALGILAFVFSMLGMGGSQLYIPVLFWLGMDFKTEAIPLGLLLNVINSGSSSYVYGKKKLIEWRTALTFGITMLIFAPLGTLLNVGLPTKYIILIFAIFTTVAAILILSGWKPKNSGNLTKKQKLILGITAGSLLGFLAGLIGRGGGSFIVPILFISGLDLKTAAATSAMTVTFSGVSAFISHIALAARINWILWGLSILCVFIGSQIGSRLMAKKMKSNSIKWVFGIILLFVAALLVFKDVI